MIDYRTIPLNSYVCWLSGNVSYVGKLKSYTSDKLYCNIEFDEGGSQLRVPCSQVWEIVNSVEFAE